MKLIKKKISELKLPEYNPRIDIESDKESKFYKDLYNSIKRYGYIEPIVWNKQSGNIVGGSQRYKILKDINPKDTEIEVVEVNLPEYEEKTLNLALNKIVGDWSQEKLLKLLNDLKENEPGLLNNTGFSEMEIENLLTALPEFDPIKEWRGMPEFEMDNLIGRTIIVHFKEEKDVQKFAKLVGQKITNKTKYIWFPYQEKESLKNLRCKEREVEDE